MGEPYWASEDGDVVLHLGKCEDVLRGLPDNSVDSIVTDPPYGLEFMGAEWDTFRTGDGFRRSRNEADAGRDSVFGRTSRTSPEYSTGKPSAARIRERVDGRTNPAEGKSVTTTPEAYVAGQPFQAWCQEWATECLRVLKPGGWMLAFGGTRTWHRLTCGIEDAGFDIHDGIADLIGQEAPGLMWVYGSGFPKSRDAARSVDMEVCTLPGRHCMRKLPDNPKPDDHVCPESEEGKAWRGWGTAAKPAWEPVVVARKPLAGTLGRNLLEYGTGAINVDGCRVAGTPEPTRFDPARHSHDGWRHSTTGAETAARASDAGRWVPNVLITHSAECADECAPGCPAAELDRQSGGVGAAAPVRGTEPSMAVEIGGVYSGRDRVRGAFHGDAGGASRFFPAFRYSAKAPASERPRLPDGTAWPTVKPLPLVRYLVCLVTPPGGTVLDQFSGSGTTGEACIIEGFPCILIDKDPAAAELTKTRLRKSIQPVMFRPEDSAPAAPVRPVAASRPKPVPEVHASLFDDLESAS